MEQPSKTSEEANYFIPNVSYFMTFRKFPNRGAGRVAKPLGGALITERAISPSSGFLQIENRTIFG